jgi:redox-sensitive bicupin YhaK (pirin superfamily)
LLPAAARRSIGPFIFFDHFGPTTLAAEKNSDLGVHPHIGIATVTYLFEGSLLHRDSLGTVQTITPGAINWMTAGRGIVHSERTVDTERGKERRQHGLQLWVALPPDQETVAPSFQHVAAADLPLIELEGGVQISVLAGSAFGRTSPVKTLSATLYLDVYLPPGHEFTLPVLASEMALYSPEHALVIDGQEVAGQQLVVLQQAPVTLLAEAQVRAWSSSAALHWKNPSACGGTLYQQTAAGLQQPRDDGTKACLSKSETIRI